MFFFSLMDALDIEWVASEEILAEYKEVLSRKKFHLPKGLVKEWLDLLDDSITMIPASLEIEFPRDRKDAKLIACALSADADLLITGDKDFFEAEKMMNTTILSVAMSKKLSWIPGASSFTRLDSTGNPPPSTRDSPNNWRTTSMRPATR